MDHALSLPAHDGLTFDDLGYLVEGLDETFRSLWGKRSAQWGWATDRRVVAHDPVVELEVGAVRGLEGEPEAVLANGTASIRRAGRLATTDARSSSEALRTCGNTLL
jgi:hypothetical protein